MLVYFKVSNSRSIGEEVTFSAIATDDDNLPENTIDVPKYGIKLLKTMALFGANASGKSNFLKAIEDAKQIICKPNYNEKIIEFNYNRNQKENVTKPTLYAFTFLIKDTIYNYSFSHNSERIIEEILTENIDTQQEKVIFSRKYNFNTKKYDWQPQVFFEAENTDFFKKSTASHKLFLSVANNPVNPDAVEAHSLLSRIYLWFISFVPFFGVINNPGKINNALFIKYIFNNEKKKQRVLDICKKVNLVIDDIKIIEVPEDYDNKYKKYSFPYREDKTHVIIKIIRRFFDKNNKPYFVEFDFAEESHGTQQFLGWLGTWLSTFQLNDTIAWVVDELGTSLHPKLMLILMKIFANEEINTNNSQLIFTTHEVKLMDKTVMRPDQLYLINKNSQGNTTIKRASDFDTEKYTRLDNLYMNGAISGVPSITL